MRKPLLYYKKNNPSSEKGSHFLLSLKIWLSPQNRRKRTKTGNNISSFHSLPETDFTTKINITEIKLRLR